MNKFQKNNFVRKEYFLNQFQTQEKMLTNEYNWNDSTLNKMYYMSSNATK